MDRSAEDSAATLWTVRVEPRRSSALRSALRWIVSLASAAQAGSATAVPVDVVLSARSGEEVRRIPADSLEEGDAIRRAIEKDLAARPAGEFRTAWLPDLS